MATATTQQTKSSNGPHAGPPSTAGTGPGAGHNIAAAREAALAAWLDQCRQFGEAAGAGDTSKVGWFQDMVQRAYRDELTPDDAEKGTEIYLASRRKRAAMLGKRINSGNGSSLGVRASEARKMIKLGGLAQFREVNNGGLGVFNAALKVIGDDAELKGEAAKLLLKVATEQLRKPDAPMDNDYIRQVLVPKESADKGEGEYLHQAKKAIELAVKASSWDAHKRSANTSLQARLEQIGFKTAAERRLEEMAKKKIVKEKAEAKARAAAKKSGKK